MMMLKACGRQKKERTFILQHIMFDFSSLSLSLLFFCFLVCVFFEKRFFCVCWLPADTICCYCCCCCCPRQYYYIHAYVSKRKNVNYDDGKKQCPQDVCFFSIHYYEYPLFILMELKEMYCTICLLAYRQTFNDFIVYVYMYYFNK